MAKDISRKGLAPLFINVSNTDCNMAYISAPRSERKCPDTFCFTFTLRIARSARLSKLFDNLAYPNFNVIQTFHTNSFNTAV